jgi:hypothetical protein
MRGAETRFYLATGFQCPIGPIRKPTSHCARTIAISTRWRSERKRARKSTGFCTLAIIWTGLANCSLTPSSIAPDQIDHKAADARHCSGPCFRREGLAAARARRYASPAEKPGNEGQQREQVVNAYGNRPRPRDAPPKLSRCPKTPSRSLLQALLCR